MGKKGRTVIGALVLLALGVMVWLMIFMQRSEPVYQRRRLSAWLAAYPESISSTNKQLLPQVDDAVRHIGTNAIPTLLQMLRARDSALTLKLLALAQRQHFIKFHFVPAWQRNLQAAAAFSALGAEGRDAVPALMKIYDENISPGSRLAAVSALGNIGPAAKEAEPFLLRVATDTNIPLDSHSVRLTALSSLAWVRARPESAVPASTNLPHDSN